MLTCFSCTGNKPRGREGKATSSKTPSKNKPKSAPQKADSDDEEEEVVPKSSKKPAVAGSNPADGNKKRKQEEAREEGEAPKSAKKPTGSNPADGNKKKGHGEEESVVVAGSKQDKENRAKNRKSLGDVGKPKSSASTKDGPASKGRKSMA